MRPLLAAALVLSTTGPLLAVDGQPHLPGLREASVQAAADLPGYLVLADPRSTRGYDALLIPVARIVWITDRVAPKGTREERTLTIAVDVGEAQPILFAFDDDTAAKPADVLAAIAAARR
jgi:hypothetical protein